MGNESSTATAPTASVLTNTSIPTTKAITPITSSDANNNTAVPTTIVATTTTSTAAPTTTVATAATTTAVPTTIVATTTTTTAVPTTTVATTKTTTAAAATTTTTTTATATTPTSTITSTASATKDTLTTPVSTEGTSKPTVYSVAKSLTSDADKAKSASLAYSTWYKWGKVEKQKLHKDKTLWYMSPPVTTTDTLSPTTTTLAMTTAKIDDDSKEASDVPHIAAVPSFSLRSTAIYSPPHGDRVPSGRNELIKTDTSIFKYYLPENRSKPMVGLHTKATMYLMNTLSKRTPLPTQSSPLRTINSNVGTNLIGDNTSLAKRNSHGQQTNFKTQPINSASTQIRHDEPQESQLVTITPFSNSNSNNNGFFHLASRDTISQPVFPPIEKTPVKFNDQPRLPVTQSFPSSHPLPPTSILKNSSTVLSQDTSNPLSGQTHDKALEELRKHNNKNTKDGTYPVKKNHLLEKNDLKHYSSAVSFDLPPPRPTKASQSISRSQKLFFSQLFNRKK